MALVVQHLLIQMLLQMAVVLQQMGPVLEQGAQQVCLIYRNQPPSRQLYSARVNNVRS
jgi:hypothetical protein